MKLRTVLACLSMFLNMTVPALADPARVKQVDEKQVIEFPAGTAGRISYLKTAKAQYESPYAKIGEFQEGWLCGKSNDIIWNNKVFKLFSPKLDKSFLTVLTKAHYPIPGGSDKIFEEPANKANPVAKPELQVGMLIKDIAANICMKSKTALGSAYMKVFWQVYSPDAQKVIFEATTEGNFQTDSGEETSVDRIFLGAFEKAARNLLAERGFYNAVADTTMAVVKPASPEADKSTTQETVKLKRVTPSGEPLTKNITNLRAAVVTVLNSVGSGSGFFVSADGYVLTNNHVVGNDKFVKVKLVTGRELVGEVIRTDKARDVALIKTEPIAALAMRLCENEANIGEDVYVLGSPLGAQFNSTLTRGVLSAYRTMDGKRFLQSDVTILPGNSGGPLLDPTGAVIAIAVSRLSNIKTSSGMSFFIPIGDALSKLGLELN